MLKLVNIKKDYGAGTEKVEALKGINIDFRDKEFAVILGPSGCGKTTLMNIIGGLDQATSGELIINDVTTKDYKDRDWDDYRNKRIGFVFQNYNLIGHLTVLGNVEIALTISGVSVEERRKKAIEVLEKVGLGEKLNKLPNELSGGQMQRVAIARALVNDPEILLADEPSGALDSTTSVQIMDLIKEVFADKLVLMVTHNPMLAEKYATRLVTMLDGEIVHDSNPLTSVFIGKPEPVAKTKKSAMSFATSLMLSWKNLFTKKGRTILTSIAGSIGIVGIALILSISSGMNNYIADLQRDTLASNPITITESNFDVTQAMNAMQNNQPLEKFPGAKEIYVQKALNMKDLMSKNNITEGYITYVNEKLNSELYNDVIFKTGMELNLYGKKGGQSYFSDVAKQESSVSPFGGGRASNWQMMLKNDFTLSQYDILEGKFPTNANELVIIVSDTNQIQEAVLEDLGLKEVGKDTTEVPFSAVIGHPYELASNDEIYEFADDLFTKLPATRIDPSVTQTLNIVGVVRAKPTTEGGVLANGIGYLKELYTNYQTKQYNSEIVKYMHDNPTLNPLTGVEYEGTAQAKIAAQKNALRSLGGELVPNEISIYPVDFEAKEEIKKVLNNYNVGREKDDMVTYTDMSEFIGDTLSQVVNIISYVLIAFTAISLLVSSIMIGIITYVSVIERTKEIGILRSVGARKKDVTRIFNAETIIIGFFSGLIGVGFSYILSIPINLIVNNLTGVPNISSLNILAALILIIISIGLTLISGLIPAKRAAKLDPVKALRTE